MDGEVGLDKGETEMASRVRSDGNGHVWIDGQRLNFQTYVVMRLEAGREKMQSLESRTSRLEYAALSVLTLCSLAILYAVFVKLGLPKP